jgi:hypothetical protein
MLETTGRVLQRQLRCREIDQRQSHRNCRRRLRKSVERRDGAPSTNDFHE